MMLDPVSINSIPRLNIYCYIKSGSLNPGSEPRMRSLANVPWLNEPDFYISHPSVKALKVRCQTQWSNAIRRLMQFSVLQFKSCDPTSTYRGRWKGGMPTRRESGRSTVQRRLGYLKAPWCINSCLSRDCRDNLSHSGPSGWLVEQFCYKA